MLMTILSKLFLVAIVVGLVGLYHGWVDANYVGFKNKDRKAISSIIGLVFCWICLWQGKKVAFIALGVAVVTSLFVKVLIKLAAFSSNYSFRKFSEKE